MENVVRLPIDLLQLPTFRQLARVVGDVQALYVWFAVWQGLAYRMQEGGPAGRVGREELPMLVKCLSTEQGGLLHIGDNPGEVKTEALEKVLQEMLFKGDGDDLVCLRFITLHGGVSSSPRSMAQRGGDMRAFTMRMKEAQGDALQTTLSISEHKFVDEQGEPLDPELTKRVTRVIIACDNALFRPQRPPVCFTEGLIQSALVVARKFSDEEINYICRSLALHRSHPALNGLSTEKVLPQFQEMAGKLEPKA